MKVTWPWGLPAAKPRGPKPEVPQTRDAVPRVEADEKGTARFLVECGMCGHTMLDQTSRSLEIMFRSLKPRQRRRAIRWFENARER